MADARMDKLIASLEAALREKSPELLPLFATMAAEARFAFALLHDDWASHPSTCLSFLRPRFYHGSAHR